MLDDVTELAKTKVRMGDDSSIAHRSTFQRELSHHRRRLAGGQAARHHDLHRRRAGR